MNRQRHTLPLPLTCEEAARLVAVLERRGGACPLRDLARRHRFHCIQNLEQAAQAGIIRIETHKPATGRPSRVAVLPPGGVNNAMPAKLPRRDALPQGLTVPEHAFLAHYLCRRGTAFFGPRYSGSAAWAYRAVYPQARPASARSAGARIMRKPHMLAALRIIQRASTFSLDPRFPPDLFSRGREWLELCRALDGEYNRSWPLSVISLVFECRSIRDFARAYVRDFLPAPGGAIPRQEAVTDL